MDEKSVTIMTGGLAKIQFLAALLAFLLPWGAYADPHALIFGTDVEIINGKLCAFGGGSAIPVLCTY